MFLSRKNALCLSFTIWISLPLVKYVYKVPQQGEGSSWILALPFLTGVSCPSWAFSGLKETGWERIIIIMIVTMRVIIIKIIIIITIIIIIIITQFKSQDLFSQLSNFGDYKSNQPKAWNVKFRWEGKTGVSRGEKGDEVNFAFKNLAYIPPACTITPQGCLRFWHPLWS